ncbi:MAG: sugar phosphate isomerase/epimerase, partial [Methanomicrobium sp.]|nr:sugar phosphate isomerase/epimerase [Methanomicrobium sp.]
VPDKIWKLHKDALIEIGRTAREYGVTACLENMPNLPDFLCMDPDEISGMVSGVEGFGLTIDIGHANTVGKLDGFLKLIGSAKHIHIHDNVGKKDEHFPIGGGNIDWDKVFGVIKKNYSGICVVEGRNLEEAKISSEAIGRHFR